MKTKVFITAALLSCYAVCFAATSNITGNWAGTVKTPDGSLIPINYKFKADSGKITGTARAPQGAANISNGKINGDAFSFGVAISKVTIEHTATYYSKGDSVSLDIDFNGQTFHTTLKRADK